jgi:hypothetical protein
MIIIDGKVLPFGVAYGGSWKEGVYIRCFAKAEDKYANRGVAQLHGCSFPSVYCFVAMTETKDNFLLAVVFP